MSEYYEFGKQLREFLRGIVQGEAPGEVVGAQFPEHENIDLQKTVLTIPVFLKGELREKVELNAFFEDGSKQARFGFRRAPYVRVPDPAVGGYRA